MRECISCGSTSVQQEVDDFDLGTDVCKQCYREPDTNDCEECGKHLTGICYPYVCGDCLDRRWEICEIQEVE